MENVFQKDRDWVLFYNPDAGVTPHFAAQCILGRTLQEQGTKVLFAQCTALFSRCPVMDMHQLPYPPERDVQNRVCAECMLRGKAMLQTYGLQSLDMRTHLTQPMLTRMEVILNRLPANLLDFEYDNIAFGKLCAMDLILAKKVFLLESPSPEMRTAWISYIAASLLSYLLIDTLCQQYPIRRLVHFNEYSLLNAARLAAEKNGVICSSVTLAMHNNNDRRFFLISPFSIRATNLDQAQAWPTWRSLPLLPEQVRRVGDDSLLRFGATGTHVFSPPKSSDESDRLTALGFSPDRKLLVAFTSSLDETYANRYHLEAMKFSRPAREQPFQNQIEWLRTLSSYVEESSHLQLAVRIHPREGLSRRSSVVSAHLAQLKAEFDRPFKHCRFIWPEEAVSSYDLGELADVALVSWSTIGLEMARLGVPVLTSTQGYEAFPQDDFMEWGATPKDYLAMLETLLNRAPSLESIRHAFRWYYLYSLGRCLNLGDLIPAFNYEGLPPYHLPKESEAIEDALLNGKRLQDLNTERQKAAQTKESDEEEAAVLCQQLRRFIHVLCTGKSPSADYALVVLTTETPLSNPELNQLMNLGLPEDAHLCVIGPNAQIHYIIGHNIHSRRSPMSARLAHLCAFKIISKDALLSSRV